jgi:hypothetical protein
MNFLRFNVIKIGLNVKLMFLLFSCQNRGTNAQTILLQKFRNWNGPIWSSYEFSMNYQSSSNYFHIKNLVSILFIQLKRSLDWASNTEKCRGLRE